MAVSFFDGDRFCKIGSKYESVLPVPVGAVTMMLRFYNRQGMTCVCTGVGLWKPKPSRPSMRDFLILYFLGLEQKVLYNFGEVAEGHRTIKAVNFDMIFLQ